MFSRERTIATPQVLRLAYELSVSPARLGSILRRTLGKCVSLLESNPYNRLGGGAHMAALLRHAALSRARPILASQDPLYHRVD